MTYEDRLLHQLQDIVAATPAPTAHRSRVRLPLAAGATATAAAAAVVVIATGGTEPAFAIQDAPGDAVSVTINDIRDAAGLQAKLRDAGIPTVVRYVSEAPKCKVRPPGTPGTDQGFRTAGSPSGSDPGEVTRHVGPPPPGAKGVPHRGGIRIEVGEDHHATFTVDPGTFSGHDRLTITAAGGKLDSLGVTIGGVSDVPPPLCLPE